MDELIIEKKEQFNTIKGIHSRQTNRSETEEETKNENAVGKRMQTKESLPESSDFEEDEFVEEIVKESESFLSKVTSNPLHCIYQNLFTPFS